MSLDLERAKIEQRLAKRSRRQGKCRVWTGLTQVNGSGAIYGMVTALGKTTHAHRAAWFVKNGQWPERKLRNVCGATTCIRVDHWELFPVVTPTYQYDRARRANLKRKYGITPEEYDALFQKQNGRCRICHEKTTEPLQVDHCHETGRVRGLLCRPCNTAIGLIKDDPRIAKRMAKYLVA